MRAVCTRIARRSTTTCAWTWRAGPRIRRMPRHAPTKRPSTGRPASSRSIPKFWWNAASGGGHTISSPPTPAPCSRSPSRARTATGLGGRETGSAWRSSPSTKRVTGSMSRERCGSMPATGSCVPSSTGTSPIACRRECWTVGSWNSSSCRRARGGFAAGGYESRTEIAACPTTTAREVAESWPYCAGRPTGRRRRSGSRRWPG